MDENAESSEIVSSSGVPSTSATLTDSGAGAAGQQLVLSAEDAAHLLAQAGIQLGENEQVIIGDGEANIQQQEPITDEPQQVN